MYMFRYVYKYEKLRAENSILGPHAEIVNIILILVVLSSNCNNIVGTYRVQVHGDSRRIKF